MNNTLSEIQISYKPEYLASGETMSSASQIVNLLRSLFDHKQMSVREECIALYLNRGNKVTGWFKVSSGGITGTVVDIRLILSVALKSLSSNIIIAHTHPSGNLKPSNHDLALTCKLKEAARVMDISLLDHMILTVDSYYSLAQNGYL